MQKKLYIVGFVAISVFAFISSCSDPAAQAKKVRCEELMDEIKASNTSPKFDNTGTAVERSAKSLAFDQQQEQRAERSKTTRAEYTAKCK